MLQSIPYFNFDNTTEALEFYERAFLAEIITRTMGDEEQFEDMRTRRDIPIETAKHFVVNAEFEILGQQFMASDILGNQPMNNEGVNITFTFDGNNESEKDLITEFYQSAIENGCEEIMEIKETEWTDYYGKFKDPYGITWMVNAVYD